MRRSAILLSVLLVCLWPSLASAGYINLAHAEIDWTGLAFTISGDITVTSIHYAFHFNASFAESYGRNGLLERSAREIDSDGGSISSARTRFKTSNGFSAAKASTSNGFIQGTSR